MKDMFGNDLRVADSFGTPRKPLEYDVYYTSKEGNRGKILGVEASSAAEAMEIAQAEDPEITVTSARKHNYYGD